MNRDEFTRLFNEATTACFEFARRYVSDHLPNATLYEVFPNSSCDLNLLHKDEQVFPEDKLPTDEFHVMTMQQVLDFLWRDGMVPEWVDLSVVSVTERHTIVELLCCGRFTANKDRLYYNHAKLGPFGVKSPALPPDFDSKNPQRFALFNPRERRKKR